MAELTKALSKYKRLIRYPENHKGREQEYMDNLKEEIADVLLTVGQMQLNFGEEEVNKICDQKVERCVNRFFKEFY